MEPNKTMQPSSKEEVAEMLQYDEYVIGALIRVYSFQTVDEQEWETTSHKNNVGFSGTDANILTSIAKYYDQKHWLSDKQLALVKRKIGKYWSQLIGNNIYPMPSIVPHLPLKKEQIRLVETISKAELPDTVKRLEGDTFLKISFPFSQDDLSAVKALSHRRYGGDKFWYCPPLFENLEQLKKLEFEFDEIVQKAWNRLNEKTKTVTIKDIPNFNFKGLYPFQVEGVEFLESHNGRGLISDEMGLGKTIQALAWLALRPDLRPVIIVCPASLKLNWAKEIKKWMPGDSSLIISGKNGNGEKIDPSKDIYIINYDILKSRLNQLIELDPKIVIGDECFPYNTEVTTNQGTMKIGDIVEKKEPISVLSYDSSKNVLEYNKIVRYIKKETRQSLIRITHECGNFVCTKNHKIWCANENKYHKAENLTPGNLLFVQEEIRNKISYTKILFNKLFSKMENATTRNKKKGLHSRKSKEIKRKKENLAADRIWKGLCKTFFTKNEDEQSQQNPSSNSESSKDQTYKGKSPCMEGRKRRKRKTNNPSTKTLKSPKLADGSIGKNTSAPKFWLSNLLQNRCSKSRVKNRNRGGWKRTQLGAKKRVRPEKDFILRISRVVSVEILEPGDSGGYGKSEKDCQFVYNLEIEKVHNYTANKVIVSNCHFIKNRKADRTVAFTKLAKTVPHLIALTGTPIVNRPVEFFNSLNLIDPARWPNFFSYAKKYCDAKKSYFGWDFTGSSNLDELNEKIGNTMIRRLKKDVLPDLPKKVRSVVPMEITNRNEYQKASDDLISWLKELDEYKEREKEVDDAKFKWGEIKRAKKAKNSSSEIADLEKEMKKAWIEKRDSFNKKQKGIKKAAQIIRIEKLKQLAVDGKMDACISWIENYLEQEDKLVVFCTHHKTIDVLMEKFRIGLAVQLDGRSSAKAKNQAVETFQNDPNCKLFIGNIRAAGTGITLTAASSTCFIELGWGPDDQAEDRVHRISQEAESVGAYYLLADDTIEMDIASLIDEKRQVLSAALDGTVVEEKEMLKELFNRMKRKENELEKLIEDSEKLENDLLKNDNVTICNLKERRSQREKAKRLIQKRS